ncbi:MAG: homoserine kinase [Streptosporangiales bacterium]|nr:homoserine kinase [Streptosporangiales bacterium]
MGGQWRTGQVRVRVPATSANLGPGFDAAGLALARYDQVELRCTDAGVQVEVAGAGAGEVPTDERHLVLRAAYAAFDELGDRPSGVALTCTNTVPHGRGLGSSAAAIVAGVVAARALAGCAEPAGADALTLAARLEGHPDNVAACLLGGFTVAWSEEGQARAVRLQPVPELVALAVVPDHEQATEQARKLLPDVVPHAAAAGNAARAALLTPALTADPELLLAATEDQLHQSYRRPAMPASLKLLTRLRAAGQAAVLSGAGPTVLVLGTATSLATAKDVAAAAQPSWQQWELAVDRTGATVDVAD